MGQAVVALLRAQKLNREVLTPSIWPYQSGGTRLYSASKLTDLYEKPSMSTFGWSARQEQHGGADRHRSPASAEVEPRGAFLLSEVDGFSPQNQYVNL